MRHIAISTLLMLTLFGGWWSSASGQTTPLKPRPDAFPSEVSDQWQLATKDIIMASSVEEMASWDRYPTYQTYVDMMLKWVADYPDICTLDTIGISIEGRLILAAHIEGERGIQQTHPEFFYTSSIHGDELTGYVMMLHLIDTLLSSYGTSQWLTNLVNTTAIHINPLANPDGAYRQGDNTVQGAVRENAHHVDLNRNYPDPFGTGQRTPEQENQAMIDYFTAHQFRLSANLHGGAEVMNYPWDCFTSSQNPHPQAAWWQEVCHRFVDTSRSYNPDRFYDVDMDGVIAGGDWYVIHGGRQDYINYYHNCLEVTMEISSQKLLSCNRLPEYWHCLAPSFINFIAEIHNLPEDVDIQAIMHSSNQTITVFPNPATDRIVVQGLADDTPLTLYDLYGKVVATGRGTLDVSALPSSIYLLSANGSYTKVIKNNCAVQ